VGRAQARRRSHDPGVAARTDARLGARRERRPIRPSPGRGEPQGGKSPGEPGIGMTAEMRRPFPNATGEQAPAARPHRSHPDAAAIATGRQRSGTHGTPKGAPDDPDACAEAERRRRQQRARGDAHRRTACPFGTVTPQSQSHEGMLRREAKAIPIASSSEGRTPRARPVERYRGDRGGSKASKPAGTAGTQRDPKEATSGVVARHDSVALKGNKPRESGRHRKTVSRPAGQHSEAGMKSWKDSQAGHTACARCPKTARWMNHEAGSPNP
jgi:hypothetical protein